MRARVLVGVLLVALGLTACSDGEPPGATLPPVTATPSESADGEVPEEAQAATREGAAAFARHYIEAVSDAYRLKDARRLEELSAPDCQACQNYIGTVDSLLRDDASVGPAYKIEILDIAAAPVGASVESVEVLVVLRVGEFVVTDKAGQELASSPPEERLAQTLSLSRANEGWVVSEVTNE